MAAHWQMGRRLGLRLSGRPGFSASALIISASMDAKDLSALDAGAVKPKASRPCEANSKNDRVLGIKNVYEIEGSLMVEEIDQESFIRQQFESNGIFFRMERHDFRIDCPWKPSDSGQQKMSIHIDGSKMHCWSCGISGNYNTVADKLGLKKLPSSTALAFSAVERVINDAEMERGLPSMPKDLKPIDRTYRGLDIDFLKKFDSKLWFDLDSSAWRILWPVSYNGQLQGWTAGRLDGETMPKYRHGPQGVIQTRRVLWPIDNPTIRDVVVLTEGPFDTLRLLREGIPAMAILGAGNWHSAKISMMKQRKYPIKGVVIAFDGDDEGWEGAKIVYKSIRHQFECVKMFQVPETKDPGNMSMKFVEELRAMVEDVTAQVRKPERQTAVKG